MGRLIATLVAVACVALFSAVPAEKPRTAEAAVSVSDANEKAIAQAIEDEIYDWGCQAHFEFLGDMIAPEKHQLRVYINPRLKDGGGEIIYKFMPFGEVYRSFGIDKNGLVHLDDTPQQGFGPERPNYETVYMDDDDLLKDKERWIRAIFVIEEHPGKERLRQARNREHDRRGDMDHGPYQDCPV